MSFLWERSSTLHRRTLPGDFTKSLEQWSKDRNAKNPEFAAVGHSLRMLVAREEYAMRDNWGDYTARLPEPELPSKIINLELIQKDLEAAPLTDDGWVRWIGYFVDQPSKALETYFDNVRDNVHPQLAYKDAWKAASNMEREAWQSVANVLASAQDWVNYNIHMFRTLPGQVEPDRSYTVKSTFRTPLTKDYRGAYHVK